MRSPVLFGVAACAALLLGVAGVAQADTPLPSPTDGPTVAPTAPADPSPAAAPSLPDAPLTVADAPVRVGVATLLKRLNPSADDGVYVVENGTWDSAVLGSVRFFTAQSAGGDWEPWRTDGTAAGTKRVADLVTTVPPAGSSTPSQYVTLGHYVYFVASETDGGDNHLWRSNGSASGTTEVAGATPFTDPNGLTVMGGKLYFSAYDTTHGRELWVSDGTSGAGTRILADIDTATTTVPTLHEVDVDADLVGSDVLRPLFVDGSTLYFTQADGPTSIQGLWRTQGTAATTWRVSSVFPIEPPAKLGSTYYFGAYDTASSAYGVELYTMSSDHLSLFADLRMGPDGSAAHDVTAFNGRVYFRASIDGTNATVWRTDGTLGGTIQIVGGGAPIVGYDIFDTIVVAGSSLYFGGSADGGGSYHLYRVTGTNTPVAVGPAFTGIPVRLFAVGSSVYFRGTDTDHGAELWLSKGTVSTTRLVVDLAESADDSNAIPAFTRSGKLFFIGKGKVKDTGVETGYELWSVAY